MVKKNLVGIVLGLSGWLIAAGAAATDTPTVTPTATLTATATNTRTSTLTFTATPTATASRTTTNTATFTSTQTPLPTATATFSGLVAGPAFTAVDAQGRPLTGSTVNITDSMGNPVLYCLNMNCSAVGTVVPGNGIVQFYGSPGAIYNTQIAGNGVTRQYVVVIPLTQGGTGGGITSLNGLTASAITIQAVKTGSDFNITTPDATHINLNLPDAGTGSTGLVNRAAQSFVGVKTFVDGLFADNSVVFNLVSAPDSSFLVSTSVGNPCTFQVDKDNNQVDISICDGTTLEGKLNVQSTDFHSGVAVENTGIGNGITSEADQTGYGVEGLANVGSTGGAIFGTSLSGTAIAGYFSRNINGSTAPVVKVSRGAATDATPLLLLTDATGLTNAPYSMEYDRNGSRLWGITPNGQFESATGLIASGTVSYSFKGDTNTGLRWVTATEIALTTGGNDIIIAGAEGTQLNGGVGIVNDVSSANEALLIVNGSSNDSLDINSGAFVVDSSGGELKFAGVASDGTGKVTCVKADGFIGTCTTVVGSGGTCTCA